MDKVKIKDVCDILNGFAFKSDNYVDKGIRIIRIANVQKGYIEDSTPAFYPLNSTGLDKYMLDKGDLLISLTGNVGRVAILQEEMLPAALNQRVACLRIKSDKISKGYLFHILNSDFFERKCIQSAKGVAQKNMSTEWLKNYKIPLYSTEQQSEIVSVLDTLQSIICNRKYELQMLDNLIKARFVEMFGHQSHNEKSLPYMTIDDVAEIYLGITHTPTYVDSGVIFISAKNTSGDFLDLSDVKYISREEFEGAPKGSKPKANDVLFSRVGSNLGHPVILEEELELCTFVSLGFLRSKGTVTSNYLKHWMRDEFFARQVSEHVKGGGPPNLNTGWLKEFKIIVPDMDQQKKFDAFCCQIDKSKLLSGCRLFHSWAPENRDKPKHVGVPRRKTKVLRGGRRQQ